MSTEGRQESDVVGSKRVLDIQAERVTDAVRRESSSFLQGALSEVQGRVPEYTPGLTIFAKASDHYAVKIDRLLLRCQREGIDAESAKALVVYLALLEGTVAVEERDEVRQQRNRPSSAPPALAESTKRAESLLGKLSTDELRNQIIQGTQQVLASAGRTSSVDVATVE